jgi:Mg2+-importing ATPase
LYFFICPHICGGTYAALDASGKLLFASIFQTGWFVESMWSQTLVIHMIRTPKVPFLQSHASWQVTLLTSAGILLLTVIPFTGIGRAISLQPLPAIFFACLACILAGYMVLVTFVKNLFVRRCRER